MFSVYIISCYRQQLISSQLFKLTDFKLKENEKSFLCNPAILQATIQAATAITAGATTTKTAVTISTQLYFIFLANSAKLACKCTSNLKTVVLYTWSQCTFNRGIVVYLVVSALAGFSE